MTENKIMNHEGYFGSVEISLKDNLLHGKILNTTDLITYEGSTVLKLKLAFYRAVDNYEKTIKLLKKG